jgi:hypothetical protein
LEYSGQVKPEDLRAFAERDWAAIERAKLDYWVELTRSVGPRPALLAADALRRHAARYATLGDDVSRAEDFAHHVGLKQGIDAASRRLGR